MTGSSWGASEVDAFGRHHIGDGLAEFEVGKACGVVVDIELPEFAERIVEDAYPAGSGQYGTIEAADGVLAGVQLVPCRDVVDDGCGRDGALGVVAVHRVEQNGGPRARCLDCDRMCDPRSSFGEPVAGDRRCCLPVGHRENGTFADDLDDLAAQHDLGRKSGPPRGRIDGNDLVSDIEELIDRLEVGTAMRSSPVSGSS